MLPQKLTIYLLAVFCLTLLAGCATKSTIEDDSWYVRSEFTWWEARKEFELKSTDIDSVKQAEFLLTPDGSAFHIKIADRLWSLDKNCGAPVNSVSNLVSLSQWLPLDCNYQGQKIMPLDHSYKFLPSQISTYRILVKFINNKPMSFKVDRVD